MYGNGLSIDNMDIGIDSEGMDKYIETLRVKILEEVSTVIDDVADVEKAICDMWQGLSRDKFLNDFAEIRGLIKDDLKAEFFDILTRFKELQKHYFEQDSSMMDK